jgi:hypothetical protein
MNFLSKGVAKILEKFRLKPYLWRQGEEGGGKASSFLMVDLGERGAG